MDTIAAIATPVGQSAIGIIKISGPFALEIAEKLYKSCKNYENKKLTFVPSHTLHYGFIVDPVSGKKIDETLIAVMRAPNTYTREDVVEINCHGGKAPLLKTLDLVLKAGARLAEPGEFTKRAFLNGRIDLTQAEAVIDLINTQSEQSLHLLVSNLEGNTFKPLYSIQQEAGEWAARIEAELNFPEDLSWSILPEKLISSIDKWSGVIRTYLDSYESSKFLIEGMRLVITGKTNVGKSSLMNQLLKKDRSIITCIPGTTTDVIEDFFYLKGILIRIADTAGFGQFRNEIEKEGIRRSQESISQADVIMLVLDVSKPLDEFDYAIFELLKQQRKSLLIILNKSDLNLHISKDSLERVFDLSIPILSVSALMGVGISEITQTLSDILTDQVANANAYIAINLRQKGLLVEIQQSLMTIKDLIKTQQPEDQLAEEFRMLTRLFKQFRGDLFSEDLLDQVFEKFCIGK
jgi:tRNA modification GTPase